MKLGEYVGHVEKGARVVAGGMVLSSVLALGCSAKGPEKTPTPSPIEQQYRAEATILQAALKDAFPFYSSLEPYSKKDSALHYYDGLSQVPFQMLQSDLSQAGGATIGDLQSSVEDYAVRSSSPFPDSVARYFPDDALELVVTVNKDASGNILQTQTSFIPKEPGLTVSTEQELETIAVLLLGAPQDASWQKDPQTVAYFTHYNKGSYRYFLEMGTAKGGYPLGFLVVDHSAHATPVQ